MSAWRPVSEAAALLGVSERTIWRRIKSETIPSRSESGRTLVVLDDEQLEAAGDMLRRFDDRSPVTVSDRTIPTGEAGELPSELREFCDRFQREFDRARRTRLLIAAVWGIASIAGVWYHFDRVASMRIDQTVALSNQRVDYDARMNDLIAQHRVDLEANAQQAARDAGVAKARGEEIQRMHSAHEQTVHQLESVQASRDVLETQVSDRLAKLHADTSQDRAMLTDRDRQIEQLTGQVASLTEQLNNVERSNSTRQLMESQLTAAARRSSAMNRGLVEGLQVYVDHQRQVERGLREKLTRARKGYPIDDVSPEGTLAADPRQAMWDSFVSSNATASDQVSQTPPVAAAPPSGWSGLLRSYGRRLVSLVQPQSPKKGAPTEMASAQ